MLSPFAKHSNCRNIEKKWMAGHRGSRSYDLARTGTRQSMVEKEGECFTSGKGEASHRSEVVETSTVNLSIIAINIARRSGFRNRVLSERRISLKWCLGSSLAPYPPS